MEPKSNSVRRVNAIALLFAGIQLVASCTAPRATPVALVRVEVVEAGRADPLPCRVHLIDAKGDPQRVDGLPFWNDHFVFAGTGAWQLPLGEYRYTIERGPEYESRTGAFEVGANAASSLQVELRRLTDLSAEGWWSGDLHVHRAAEDIELLMRAEDVYIAPVITWWQDRERTRDVWPDESYPANPRRSFDGRFADVMAGEDERDGGALLYFHLDRPLDTEGATAEYPDPMQFVEDAHRANPDVWIDIEKPFWWDVPVWLASGRVDSIGLANNHMCRNWVYESEAWGRPRDVKRLPPPQGNGFWSQEIYYKMLECGLRIPPSAGSASGVLPNPVGHNRVYVKVDGELTWEKWWAGLRSGRSFVTNGPLLRVTANGRDPGHVFRSDAGGEIRIRADAVAREPIDVVQIIRNGVVVSEIEAGSETSLRFASSGWFLVRVLGKNEKTFQFASTAPFFVEVGGERRVSRRAAKFFLDWVEARIGRLKLEDAGERRAVLRYHDAAREFFAALRAKANAD